MVRKNTMEKELLVTFYDLYKLVFKIKLRIFMEEYDVKELKRRRPLNIFSIVLAIIFILLGLFFYLENI